MGIGGVASALASTTIPVISSASSVYSTPVVGAAPVALGVYLPTVLDDPSVFAKFTQMIDRSPAFLVWYEGWSRGSFSDAKRAHLAKFSRWGVTPMISWGPFDPEGDSVNQPAYALGNIVRGDFDAYVDSWATGLAEYGKPIWLSFAHEMNGNWNPWGVGVNGNQPGEYIAAYRRVHGRFIQAGATNVRWIWAPNELYDGVPATLAEVYPGDDYVDWFGMNGFNWGRSINWASCDCQSAWRSFAEVFGTTYDSLQTLGTKPIMICETGSSEIGGDKAAWISDALLDQLVNAYPGVRAITWFNTATNGLDTTKAGEVVPTNSVDWRVESSSRSLQAFVHAAASPYYQGILA